MIIYLLTKDSFLQAITRTSKGRWDSENIWLAKVYTYNASTTTLNERKCYCIAKCKFFYLPIKNN